MREVFLAAVLAAAPALSPPVDGRVLRPYVEPAHEYGSGHRGVDFEAPPGTPVRVAAPGTVVFGGKVADGLHVVVDHGKGLRSSYSYLARVGVSRGERLEAGAVVGESGGRGAGHEPGVVHFGVRRHGRYVDPAEYLPAVTPRIRLAPVRAAPARTCTPVAAVH